MDGNSTSGEQNRSSHASNLDFITYWADQTVENEILRGHQLREIKPHAYPKREYDVVNIDYIKSPKCGSYRRKRSHEPCSNCTNCKGRPFSPSKSEARSRKYQKQKKKKSPCGMRTAELAVPTKRQCLDAWKRNYDKLPEHMVERLRQYVLDQHPVVKIADAIHCFKMKKNVKKEKGERKKVMERPFGWIAKKPMRASDVKTLSAIFGHKIVKQLNTPLQIKLNPDLEKIAKVISFEISGLMQKSKKVNMRTKIYKDMHIDVTKKITIWVSDVLEESAYKILEDQYREFEEEVGPVLDLIDEVIDNVVNICEPEPEILEISSSESDDFKLEEEENQAVEETIEDHLQNELVGIIDNIFKDIDMKSDDEQYTNDFEQNNDLKSEPDVFMDIENDADLQQNEFADAKDNFKHNFEPNEDVNEVLNEQNEDTHGEETAAEPEEEGNQKVKFKFNEADGEENALAGDEAGNTGKVSEKSSLAQIDFASPNEELLSDADESWPAEIQPPIVRPSESASKSITSLGKILEDEEKSTPPEVDANELEGATTTSNNAKEEKTEITEISDTRITPEQATFEHTPEETAEPVEKKTFPRQSEKPAKEKKGTLSKERKFSKEKTSPERNRDKTSSERKSETSERKITKPGKKVKPIPKPKPEKSEEKTKILIKMPKISKTLGKRKERSPRSPKDKSDNEVAGTSQSVKNLVEEGRETAKDIKFSSLRVKKQNYRVNVNTAPAWVTKSYGEPSCVCIDMDPQAKPSCKLKYDSDIRKWVRDLEHSYENLKLWNEWIDTTSRTINILQQEIGGMVHSEKSNKKPVHKLIALKSNIDKDATLWRKLRKCTQERLRSYRKIYQIQKVRDCNRSLLR